MSSLPEEIQVEILLKSPVKSLLTCKCVCKPWHRLISSQKFINDHLNLSIQNKNNQKIMFTDNESVTGKPLMYSIDYASISSSSSSSDLSGNYYIGKEQAFLIDTPFEYKKAKEVRILGVCNGLFCFGILINTETRICIWNPATREYKEIQHCDFRLSPWRYPTVGFGYDSKTGDYKIVQISDSIKTGYCEVQVYTFVGSHSSSKTTRILPYNFPRDVLFCGFFLNGALHWTSNYKDFSGHIHITSFDTSSDKLTDVTITLPEDSNRGMSYKTIGTLGGCLSLFLLDEKRGQAEVWVMQDYGIRESWTKLFTTAEKQITNFPFWIPILSLRNGDILICTITGYVLCDPRNNKVGKVNRFGNTMSFSTMITAHPEIYVESLVSLNSGTYVSEEA